MTDPIDRLEAELARLAGPTARLHRIAEFRLELERIEERFVGLRREAIREAKANGAMTWAQIGGILGVSLQRAHELANTPPTPKGQP